MLDTISKMNLEQLPIGNREAILQEFQSYLVRKVADFHSRQRLSVAFDLSSTTWQFIHDLLIVADEAGKAGPVAQYIVGAKLQLRFPDIEIGNESYSTADTQLDRQGDYVVGDTAFHITVSPMVGVYERCKINLARGMRAYILVPDTVLEGTRQNASATAEGKIGVDSIESFVSQNLEELSGFSREGRRRQLRELLEVYNRRVNETEIDKSMLIDLPLGIARDS